MNILRKLPKGLTLVEGHSHETITKILMDGKVPYEVHWENKTGYFRSAPLTLDPFVNLKISERIRLESTQRAKKISESEQRIIKLVGYPDNNRSGALSWYGFYRVESEFDWSQISGIIKLDQGHLIERTLVYIR